MEDMIWKTGDGGLEHFMEWLPPWIICCAMSASFLAAIPRGDTSSLARTWYDMGIKVGTRIALFWR
jgi:hypothetical protein